jgi:hypothetical protein
MEENDELTINNIKDMVAKAPWANYAKARTSAIRDLEEINKIVQEFTNTRFPDRAVHEALKDKNSVLPDVEPPPGRGDINETLEAVMKDHLARIGDVGKLMEADIPRLREQWVQLCQDIMNGVPEELPPVRGVNHHITLLDDNKRYNYHLPRCPDALKTQLLEKMVRYM